MTDNKVSDTKRDSRNILSRREMYGMIAKEGRPLILKLIRLTDHKNANIALGALNKLIDKVLPNLRATEITGEEGASLTIKLIDGGYISRPVKTDAAPKTGVVSGQP